MILMANYDNFEGKKKQTRWSSDRKRKNRMKRIKINLFLCQKRN